MKVKWIVLRNSYENIQLKTWSVICKVRCLSRTVATIFVRRLQILKLAKHARFLQDLAQIRTTEVDRARGNWQRCAMNAAFTGLRKRGDEAAVRNAVENAKQ